MEAAGSSWSSWADSGPSLRVAPTFALGEMGTNTRVLFQIFESFEAMWLTDKTGQSLLFRNRAVNVDRHPKSPVRSVAILPIQLIRDDISHAIAVEIARRLSAPTEAAIKAGPF